MYVPDSLNRMDEEATLKFLEELTDDDGKKIKCEFCDEDAVDGLALYNPADALRNPPVTGIYATLIRCEDCRDMGYGEDDTFWCEGCEEHFIVNHSWDIVAASGEEGYECQKCFAEKLEGQVLGEVLQDLRDGETGRFKRLNSVPGKEEFFEGEFAPYPDFPGYNDWDRLADAISAAAKENDIGHGDIVYPIVDHGYQFSVSLSVYS